MAKRIEGLDKKTADEIEQNDLALECACGTGAISKHIASKYRQDTKMPTLTLFPEEYPALWQLSLSDRFLPVFMDRH